MTGTKILNKTFEQILQPNWKDVPWLKRPGAAVKSTSP